MAVATTHKAARHEVIADVLADTNLGGAFQAVAYLVKEINADQGFMLAFKPINSVCFAANMTSIKWVVQNIRNPLVGNPALFVARKVGVQLKETAQLGLRAKATGGKALKGFMYHCGKCAIGKQHPPATLNDLIFITDRGGMHPIAALHSRFHLLGNLATVLLALQRTLGGHDGFDKLTFGRVLKFEIQAFDTGTAQAESVAQIQMEPRIAGEAFEVVKDHHIVLRRLSIEIRQQGNHAWAFHKITTARDGVGECGFDKVAFGAGIFTATGFL